MAEKMVGKLDAPGCRQDCQGPPRLRPRGVQPLHPCCR
jgi:hypothetical protein